MVDWWGMAWVAVVVVMVAALVTAVWRVLSISVVWRPPWGGVAWRGVTC